jgi:predicted SprT family Zn-dependent metalloprotease
MKTINLICTQCKRTLSVSEETWDDALDNGNDTCKKCGGELEVMGAVIKDRGKVQNTIEDEDEEENEEDQDDDNLYDCDECDDEFDITKEGCEFPNSETYFCNKCMIRYGKIKPEIQYKDKIVEKVVEKPIYISKDNILPSTSMINTSEKSRFD